MQYKHAFKEEACAEVMVVECQACGLQIIEGDCREEVWEEACYDQRAACAPYEMASADMQEELHHLGV